MSDDIPNLWAPEDCARYLGVARWTFVNRISKLPTFPKPRVELTRRTRRWHPDDVRDWQYRAGRQTKNIPAARSNSLT